MIIWYQKDIRNMLHADMWIGLLNKTFAYRAMLYLSFSPSPLSYTYNSHNFIHIFSDSLFEISFQFLISVSLKNPYAIIRPKQDSRFKIPLQIAALHPRGFNWRYYEIALSCSSTETLNPVNKKSPEGYGIFVKNERSNLTWLTKKLLFSRLLFKNLLSAFNF